MLTNEKLGWCCHRGQYHHQVPVLPRYPAEAWHYLYTHARDTSLFSRKLNNLFAFSSIRVSGGFVHGLGVPSNVAISGRVYHQMRDTAQGEHSMRWFLYDEASRAQQVLSQKIPEGHFNIVNHLIRTVNPYVGHLQHAASRTNPDECFALELRDDVVGGEVAAILHTSLSTPIAPRSVVIWNHGETSTRTVNILSSHYEPLQYPLLFPQGTPGWHPGVSNNCSQIRWYRMRILRDERFHLFGRLGNEYLVDMYSRVEDQRLDYLRRGRKQQLADMKEVIREARERINRLDVGEPLDTNEQPEDRDTNCTAAEESFLLPATFPGSRAWASEQVSDSLAIVADRGDPSLFITMTTNPNWPEIQTRLLPGQQAADIPDIVNRAFKARLSNAMSQIRKHFGKVAYSIKVTEFQKRGLPHIHMVLRLGISPHHDCSTDFKTNHLCDHGTEPGIPFHKLSQVISAEIPLEEDDPELRQLVLTYNQHPRSHLTSQRSRCNKDGRCIWRFPHQIREHNELDPHGKVRFRRRREEDCWTAPYIPFLLRTMQCHVYVDVTSTVNVLW